MNKAELVQAMADDAGLSKSDAEKALNAFVEIVGGELGKGGGSIPPVGVALAIKIPTASFLMFLAIQRKFRANGNDWWCCGGL